MSVCVYMYIHIHIYEADIACFLYYCRDESVLRLAKIRNPWGKGDFTGKQHLIIIQRMCVCVCLNPWGKGDFTGKQDFFLLFNECVCVCVCV